MWVIRPEQMEAFKQAALRNFENEMVAHLAEFSPPLFKAVGEQQMRRVIQLGVDRAGDYGFNCRGPVRLYLELMLLFGSYFDTDPHAAIVDPAARARRLKKKALTWLEQVLAYFNKGARI